MANIPTFDTPALGLRPTETGIETVAGNARRVGAFYNQGAGALESLAASEKSAFGAVGRGLGSGIQAAGDAYVNYENHKEISAGAPVASAGFVNLEKQWNDTVKNADPNDTSVAAKFKETVFEPWAEKFAQNFTTEKSQEYAEGIVNRYRQHFDTKTAADMSTMAGIAAKQNAQKTINNLSSAVYTDPSSLDTAIDTLKHSAEHIVGSSPTIDAETGARVTAELNQKGVEALVKSAVSGMIAKNPNVDLDAIQKKYGDYINGGELKMFQKAAQTQEKTNLYYEKQIGILQRQQDDQKVHAGATKAITDYVTFDQTGKPIIDPRFFPAALDIARQNPNAPSAAATARTMLDWGEAQQKHEVAPISDPSVRGDILTRMSSTDKFPTEIEILRAQAEHKLSQQDGKELLELHKAITQRPEGDSLKRDHAEFFKQYGPSIDPQMKQGNPTPLGAQGIYKAEMDAYRVERFLQSKGLDPHLAYDPTSPYFLGKPERISAYRPTMQEQMEFDKQAQGKKPETAMPAIPPVDQRTPGLYETPKGKLRWTGTGWVKP